ncbi:MAG: P-loop NTPase [Fimbriimonadaceae bacterium]|nr:P-loop NTPase [Fimbriimonadaceae bacterium]
MRVLAVTGGKGGVGKTTLSIALAMALAEKGKRVVLFDADLALANIDVMLGLKPEFTLQHVLSGEKTVRETIHEGPGGIRMISGAAAVGSLMSAGPKRLAKFFTQLFAIESETDYLIFDTGSGIDRRVMAFLKVADEALVVSTPDPASVTDAYATVKMLSRQKKGVRAHVLANVVDNEIEAQRSYKTLAAITMQFLKADLNYLGFIRRDDEASRCVRQRRPFMLAAPDCLAAQDMREVAKAVLELEGLPVRSFTERIEDQYSAA